MLIIKWWFLYISAELEKEGLLRFLKYGILTCKCNGQNFDRLGFNVIEAVLMNELMLADIFCNSISLHYNFILCSLQLSRQLSCLYIWLVFVHNFTVVTCFDENFLNSSVKRICNSICEINECQPSSLYKLHFCFSIKHRTFPE
jgi:hypothetical protein